MRHAFFVLLVLAGCGGSDEKPVTVSGAVLSDNLVGIPNLTVSIWSAKASEPIATNTAADGTFSIAKITPPYDVVISLANNNNALYLGVSRPDPQLVVTTLEPASGTTVNVALPPGAAADTETVVADCGSSYRMLSQPASSSSVAVDVFGVADPTSNCTIDVFRYSFDAPIGSYAFGSVKQRLAPEMAVTSVDAVTARDLAVTLSPASGLTVDNTLPEIVTGRVPMAIAHGQIDGAAPFTMLVPSDAKFALALHVLAIDSSDATAPTTDVHALVPTTGPMSIDIPAPLRAAAPDNEATGIDAASVTLQINGAAGYGYMFSLLEAHTASWEIYTTADSVSAHTLASRGISLKAGTTYTWTAQAVSGIDSMDDVSAGAMAAARYGSRNSVVTMSGARTFTTSP